MTEEEVTEGNLILELVTSLHGSRISGIIASMTVAAGSPVLAPSVLVTDQLIGQTLVNWSVDALVKRPVSELALLSSLLSAGHRDGNVVAVLPDHQLLRVVEDFSTYEHATEFIDPRFTASLKSGAAIHPSKVRVTILTARSCSWGTVSRAALCPWEPTGAPAPSGPAN